MSYKYYFFHTITITIIIIVIYFLFIISLDTKERTFVISPNIFFFASLSELRLHLQQLFPPLYPYYVLLNIYFSAPVTVTATATATIITH